MVFGTALAMVDGSAIISTRWVAQRTVVMFDTCHSSAGIATESLSNEDFSRLKLGAGRYVLSSCDANQKSYEANGHGYFTSSLIATLRGRQGCIRTTDRSRRCSDVSTQVMAAHKLLQRPIMAKSDDAAEIVLGASAEGSPQACSAAGQVSARQPWGSCARPRTSGAGRVLRPVR